MDGKNRQEVRNYILIFLAAFFFLTAVFFIDAAGEENSRRYQIAELIRLYPEMEADLIRIMEKSGADGRESMGAVREPDEETAEILNRLGERYGYVYTSRIKENRIWRLYGISIFGMGVFFVILRLVSGRKKASSGLSLELLGELDRILYEFSRGNYQAAQRAFPDIQEERQRRNCTGMEYESWAGIRESLHELGMYFEDLKKSYDSEEEKTKALITNISHQLKTPLASLRMSHELAGSDYLTREEKQEYLMQEEREIGKLQKLLDEMIKLSRLEKHMIQLRPETASLRDTISDAVSAVYPRALAKSMPVRVDMEEELRFSHDAHWTAEALANILDNAVKYAPAETQITIQVRRLTRYALVEITDEGPGIPEKEKHQIYQRFYRGERSRGVEGTGVGLYLTRQIIEAQKGSILVKNHYPTGSTFQILLLI